MIASYRSMLRKRLLIIRETKAGKTAAAPFTFSISVRGRIGGKGLRPDELVANQTQALIRGLLLAEDFNGTGWPQGGPRVGDKVQGEDRKVYSVEKVDRETRKDFNGKLLAYEVYLKG